jgi:protein-tyrosine phosphatase
MIERILVICEGNVCRSPMAQGLLAQRLPTAAVMSAGSAALVGRGADPIAIELMARRRIDIGSHIAAALNLELVRSAELVLAMTGGQRKWVETRYPFSKGKVFRIAERDGVDIDDPYGKGQAAFEKALMQIERGLAFWYQALNKMSH